MNRFPALSAPRSFSAARRAALSVAALLLFLPSTLLAENTRIKAAASDVVGRERWGDQQSGLELADGLFYRWNIAQGDGPNEYSLGTYSIDSDGPIRLVERGSSVLGGTKQLSVSHTNENLESHAVIDAWGLADNAARAQPGETPFLGGVSAIKIGQAAVTTDNVRVRRAPSTSAEIVQYSKSELDAPTQYIPKGTELEVLARTEAKEQVGDWNNWWYLVRWRVIGLENSSLSTGWAFAEFISLKPSSPGSASLRESAFERNFPNLFHDGPPGFGPEPADDLFDNSRPPPRGHGAQIVPTNLDLSGSSFESRDPGGVRLVVRFGEELYAAVQYPGQNDPPRYSYGTYTINEKDKTIDLKVEEGTSKPRARLYRGASGDDYALYLDGLGPRLWESGTGHRSGDSFKYDGTAVIGAHTRATIVQEAKLLSRPASTAPLMTRVWPLDDSPSQSLVAQTRVEVIAATKDNAWYLVLYPDLKQGVARSWVAASNVLLDGPKDLDDRVGAAFLIYASETMQHPVESRK